MSGGGIFLIIFLVIVIGLVLIAIYGSRKSKKEKEKKFSDLKTIENSAKTYHVELYIVLSKLIEKVNHQLQSIGTENTISDVNVYASETLTKIKNSNELQFLYKSEERKREFSQILDSLFKTKASKWNTEAFFALNLIEAKCRALNQIPEYAETIRITKEKY